MLIRDYLVLTDGEDLARLMVQHHVGVRTRDLCEIKRIVLLEKSS